MMVIEGLGKLGLFGLTIPKKYGWAWDVAIRLLQSR